ncbi:Oxygen sensor histidine kinase NreB [Lignipirellula cremea]|uniref:histidine kinase n=2 Tax=Lignipirellula cremea TaxID=2528010 RepID=A0A518DRS5_9BACT|nr:Oxygen sensor histidine kinase NreB [Lignipirellula cremea]
MIEFFEFSNEMLCVADSRGYFVRVNQAWTKTLGWPAEELLNRPYLDFVHPEDVQSTTREAELLLSGAHETISFENRYRCQNGSYRWLSWYVKLKFDSGQLIAAARDITADKLQTEALRESEERFEAFMDNSPAIAWAKDEQGRIVYFNKAYEDRFHVRLSDWIGKSDFDLWPSDVAETFRQNDNAVLTSGVPLSVTGETTMDDGSHTTWRSVRFVFSDRHDGKLIGGIAIDITDLKQVEDALASERELLRSVIDTQEKEKQILCHEVHDGVIQNAVGSLMMLESYQEMNPPGNGSELINKVINCLRQGVEDGRRTIQGIRPPFLDESDLESAVRELAEYTSATGITVTTKCELGTVRLPDMLQTTVYRLIQESLNNAMKHSGTEAATVELKRDGGHVFMEVRDFGCGFKLGDARKRGLGLKGMMERVRLFGGECTIESEPNKGTRIIARLPIDS